MEQIGVFDFLYKNYKITKPIRLIEFFAGYGSQALALKYLGVPFEHWKICEWAVKSIQAYKDIHYDNLNIDYSKGFNKEYLISYLFDKHISMDYNKPMTKEQIARLSEQQLRTIYNNIQIEKNTVDIQQTGDLRIRKLTSRECFRLMGVKDEDYDKIAKNQSDASLYHLAGDSIVVNVLMAIFKELI